MLYLGNDDYLFRYQTLHSLSFFSKNWTETWKECFKRNLMINANFTKENFNYKMCPIRNFKTHVEALDSYYNFVAACDNTGAVRIFLIDEQDLENDEDTLFVIGKELGAPAHFLKIFGDKSFDAKDEARDQLVKQFKKELRLSVCVVTTNAVH